jgi:hypothetical protein
MSNDNVAFSKQEKAIIEEVRAIRDSQLFDALKKAFASGEAGVFEFNDRKIFVEPKAPFAGLTWMEENAFHLGAEAFESNEELLKTLLHELYRLDHSIAYQPQGINQSVATRETISAFEFAEQASKVL